MTVSDKPDNNGEMKMIDLSGVMALAACLPECRSLTSLKCAAATPKCLLTCQRPLTCLLSHCSHPTPRSQSRRQQNGSRRSHCAGCRPQGDEDHEPQVRCRPPKCLLSCQRPLTHLRTLPPFLARFSCVKSEHISYLGLGIFLPAPAPPSAFSRDATFNRAPCGPRPRPPVGRVVQCSRISTSPPCDLPVAACSTTTSTTRPNRPSKTPRAAAPASLSSTQPRTAWRTRTRLHP